MADDGSNEPRQLANLKRAHWQRLRRMHRSAGWPYLDAIEIDLLAAGLLTRESDGSTVHLTERGIEALSRQRSANQSAFKAHTALIHRMANTLMAEGRLCFSELPLRAPIESGWRRVRPDLFSIRRTTREDRLVPFIHEIKVRRADLLADLRLSEKRAAYQAISARCYYVLGERVGTADDIPEPCGVWVEQEGRLLLQREADLRDVRINFGTWMALANAVPMASDQSAQLGF